MSKGILGIVVGLLVWSMAVGATPVTINDWVNGDDLVGERVSGEGITANGGWAQTNPYGFKISWNIDWNSTTAGKWHYEYKIYTGPPNHSKDLSHWILEVSEDIGPGNVNEKLLNPSSSFEGPRTWDENGPGKSNPGLSKAIYGIKFELESQSSTPEGYRVSTYSFDSPRQPIWGSFYAKSGRDPKTKEWVWAYNSGQGNADPDAWITEALLSNPNRNTKPWILIPDTKEGGFEEVPEAGSLLLCGLGGVLLGLREWRRRCKAKGENRE